MGAMVAGCHRELNAWLAQMGMPQLCRRVVIDIDVGDVVRVYYECFGDDRLIKIEPPAALRNAVKIRVGKENENAAADTESQ